jgi:hypothetical protein
MLRAMASWFGSYAPLAALATLVVGGAGCGNDAAPAELHVDITPSRDDLQGFEEIRGTVTFPAPVPAGKVARLLVTRSRPTSLDDADASGSATASIAAPTMTFTIRRIVHADYTLLVWVDLDGNGQLGSGDLAGYYAGATTAPVQSPAAAQLVSATNLVVADFGIGPLP